MQPCSGLPISQPGLEQRIHLIFHAVQDFFQQGVLIAVMPEESGVADVRPLGQVADADRIVAFFERQLDQGLLQQAVGALESPVSLFHFASSNPINICASCGCSILLLKL